MRIGSRQRFPIEIHYTEYILNFRTLNNISNLHFMANLRIAIIGAGPAGLTLARLLQVNNISCTLFELDRLPNSRDQGGIIDLHPEGGQRALLEAGLLDEFFKHSLPEGETTKLVKSDGTIIFDENRSDIQPAKSGDRPEINRLKLRQILLDSLKPETVQWERKVISVQPSVQDPLKYSIHLKHKIEEGFDLVVGADGAWSRVRTLVTEEAPFYSGVTAIELWALDVDDTKPWLSEFVGKGSMFMFDEGRAVIAQRSESSVRVYAAVRRPEDWITNCDIDWSEPKTAREALVNQYFGDCGDNLKRAILESTDELIARPLWMLPVGIQWEHRPGITIIGDAAHLMTPFAGVGVNVAMIDSYCLAKSIIEAKDDRETLSANIMEFERQMFERSEKFAARTLRGLESHFSAGGIEERAQLMRRKMEHASVCG
jgi:2-polyprenyl-6-methoxyphenol hydroxylase-like FAD-dependent oxidoreductase